MGLAIAVSVATLVYADGNRGKWCPLEPEPGNTRNAQTAYMAGQYDGPHDGGQAERMGSGIAPMFPGNGEMSPSAGHSSSPPAGNVMARQEKNGDFECPGKSTETGTGSGHTGGKVEKGE